MSANRTPDLEERVAALEMQLRDLKARLATLERQLAPSADHPADHPTDQAVVRRKVVYDWQA